MGPRLSQDKCPTCGVVALPITTAAQRSWIKESVGQQLQQLWRIYQPQLSLGPIPKFWSLRGDFYSLLLHHLPANALFVQSGWSILPGQSFGCLAAHKMIRQPTGMGPPSWVHPARDPGGPVHRAPLGSRSSASNKRRPVWQSPKYRPAALQGSRAGSGILQFSSKIWNMIITLSIEKVQRRRPEVGKKQHTAFSSNIYFIHFFGM